MAGGIEHLDFGVRNTLLYYKDLKTTLDMTPGSGVADAVVDRLLAGRRVPLSDLFTDADAMRSAAKRVRSISYRARRDVDKGSPGTLCVAWGLATWENGRSTAPAAPIVLRQASVGRHPGTVENFDLGVAGPWNLNVTLLRLLDVDFGIDVERRRLAALVEQLSDTGDPAPLFALLEEVAADVPGFTIAPRVVLAPVPRVAPVVQHTVATTAPDPGVADYPDAALAAVTTIGPVSDVPPVTDVATVADPPVADVTPTAAPPTVSDVPSIGDTPASEDEPARPDIAAHLDTPAPAPPAAPAPSEGDRETTADIVELLRSGVLNPRTLSDGSLERRTVERFGPDVVIGDITATLRADGWPEALVEHADSGLRVRDRGELLQRWHDASSHRPRPSGWDATHFALWGLAAAPPVGNPALRSVADWGERRHHPILVAWQLVAERRSRGHRRARRINLPSPRVTAPKGLDDALWGLPVDLLVEWAAWVFRQWPGAPFEFVLPVGSKELVSAWYERARPVTEMAVNSWVPFAAVDEALGKSAHRWVRQLTAACDGGGAPLAAWFESSMAVAAEAVALRTGEAGGPGAGRGRRGRGRTSLGPHEHAV